MERNIRARYHLKQKAVLDEVNQRRWERIDMSQVFRDINADMHRELREAKEQEEPGARSRTSSKPLTGKSRIHVDQNISTRQTNNAVEKKNEPIPTVEGRTSARPSPMMGMSPNWFEMLNQPLPPVPKEMSLTEKLSYNGLAGEAKKVKYPSPVQVKGKNISIVTVRQKNDSRRNQKT